MKRIEVVTPHQKIRLVEIISIETLQYKYRNQFLAHWNDYINLPTRYTLSLKPIVDYLFEQLPKTKLPIAKIYQVRMSGWSCDEYGKVTIYPDDYFKDSKMIPFTITMVKNK